MVSTHPTGVQDSAHKYLPVLNSKNFDLSPNQQLLPLTAKVNSHDCLEIGGCDVKTLVQQFGSPLYILDEETLRTACRQYRDSLKRYYKGESQVLYASKAWSCLAVCALVASEGLGIDVASGGELYTALTASVSPEQIYLHGNNKSREELRYAISSGITIMADNWHDLQQIVELAQGQQPVRIMLSTLR